MSKKKKPSPPPVTETEVSIGGENFRVTIRSTAKLGEVAAHGQALFRACRPALDKQLPFGFAGPGAGSHEISEPVGQSLLGMDGD